MAKLTLPTRTPGKQKVAGRDRNDVLVRDLRKTHGPHFAQGYRADTKLSEVLKREGYKSLREYLDPSRPAQTYTAVIHREEPWYVAECAELGVASQGKSIEEALANLKEATELYLEEFPSRTSGRALITTFEVKHA